VAIWVVRNTDKTGESPYGKTITENANLRLSHDNWSALVLERNEVGFLFTFSWTVLPRLRH
jgi:hypothetical protein